MYLSQDLKIKGIGRGKEGVHEEVSLDLFVAQHPVISREVA